MMIVKKSAFIFFMLLFTFLGAAGSNQWDDVIEKTYDVKDFSSVSIEGKFKIVLEQTDKAKLMIKADEEAFEYITVDNSFDQLKITKRRFDLQSITIYISFVDLKELDIEGGVSLETIGFLDLKDIKIHVEGGVKVEMGLKADRIELSGEGGVYFSLQGVADEMQAYISGAGYMNAEELKCSNVTVDVEGVGSAIVYASEKLKGSIKGVGSIKYKGNPLVEKHVEGIGGINEI